MEEQADSGDGCGGQQEKQRANQNLRRAIT